MAHCVANRHKAGAKLSLSERKLLKSRTEAALCVCDAGKSTFAEECVAEVHWVQSHCECTDCLVCTCFKVCTRVRVCEIRLKSAAL